MSDKLLPERLKTARERLGISMTEAAKRLNLSKIGYCRYEYGERSPSPQTIEVIAQCFGTSVDYLIGRTSDIEPDSIIVYKDKTPLLFEIVKDLSPEGEYFQKKVRAYYTRLKDSL